MSRFKITLLLAACSVFSTGAMAAEPPPDGVLLYEILGKCPEFDVTVLGDDSDITVRPGETRWTHIADPRITIYCGRFEEEERCPDDTDYIVVSWPGRSEIIVGCYDQK